MPHALAILFAMLFFSLLCLSSFVTSSPTFRSWGRFNPFSFNSFDAGQLPLGSLSDIFKDTPNDGVFETKNDNEGTMWEIIDNNPRFSKLARAIKFADAVQYFDDKDADFTFFATPDWALGHDDHSKCDNLAEVEDFAHEDAAPVALAQGCHWSHVLSINDQLDALPLMDDDKKERRKKFFKRLVQVILAYEALPNALDSYSLGDNTTYATKLSVPGALDGQPLRIRVAQKLLPPSTIINFFSKVVYPDVKATNGIIHVVNRPVLPPLSGFQTMFLLPGQFSILTSAIQRVKLTDSVDLRYVRKDNDDEGYELQGASALTLFAPTNSAFEHLPLKLRLFLFSPLGYRALRKVLEYHIVPNLVIHADYHYNKSAHVLPGEGHLDYLSRGKLISDSHLRLPTLLEDHSVSAHVKKFEYTLPVPGPNKPSIVRTKVSVNHRDVLVADVVASNAAVHIVDRLLDPRHHHHGHHLDSNSLDAAWEDWENWLVEWTESA